MFLKYIDLFAFVLFIILSIFLVKNKIRGSKTILVYWCILLVINSFLYISNLSMSNYIFVVVYLLPAFELTSGGIICIWFILLQVKGGEDANRS